MQAGEMRVKKNNNNLSKSRLEKCKHTSTVEPRYKEVGYNKTLII